jgi:hypothetical protein
MTFQIFVYADGIVIVRPSVIKHLPGQLVAGLLGGAVGGGVGGGLEGAMTAKEFERGNAVARVDDFQSATALARVLSRSKLYLSQDIAGVAIKKNKFQITFNHRQPALLGGRKMTWRVGNDSGHLASSLRASFGTRFAVTS